MEKKNDGTEVQGKERFITPSSGWVALFLTLVGLIGGAALPITMLANGGSDLWGICFIVPVVSLVFMCGLFIVNPNESAVVTFFGKYVGTVVDNGFFFNDGSLSECHGILGVDS